MTTSELLTPLFALAAPLFLWPVEQFLPLPYLLEEIYKGSLVFFGKPRLQVAVLIGFCFALSETAIYSMSLFELDSFLPNFFLRLITTSFLHITTTVIMAVSFHSRRNLLLVGFASSVLLHLLYNKFLGYPAFLTLF